MGDKRKQPSSSEKKNNYRKRMKKAYSDLKKVVPALQSDDSVDRETIVLETAKYLSQLQGAEEKALKEYRELYDRTEFLKAAVAEISQRMGLNQIFDSRSIRNRSTK